MRISSIIRFLTLTLFALGTLTVPGKQYSIDDLPNVQVADRTKHLVNPDGIVSWTVEAQIDTLLLDARKQSSAEVVAVIVDDIDSDDIDTYATQLLNKWGIGKRDKNNGILLIVAKDSHQATIRTGYGAEGVMPDIIAGRILRDTMVPYLQADDYDNAMLQGVKQIHKVVTDPEAAEELRSKYADDFNDTDSEAIIKAYFTVACIAAAVLLIWLLIMLLNAYGNKQLGEHQKYTYLKKNQLTFWVISLIFVGIPAISAIALWLICRHLRNHKRKCPHCHTQMNKLDEETDNKYLTYAQDLEERIKSVDYDVWLCPKCGEKDILSYVNTASNYQECKLCHAHTVKLTGTRIIQEPTYRQRGIGEKQYVCLNCNKKATKRYYMPKKEPPVVIVGGSGRGGGGFGGGGSFGGGFGGGMTGGGGASVRW